MKKTSSCVYLAMMAMILSSLTIGFTLGSLAAWSTVEELETAPEPVKAGEPAATESAVLDEPAPEIVNLGEFKVTHYCPCELCCGEWADGITSTGTVATEGRTIAVDPDVIPYGSEVVLYFTDGTEAAYIAEDCGGAIQGNRLDVFMDDHQDALAAGVKAAEVYIMEESL